MARRKAVKQGLPDPTPEQVALLETYRTDPVLAVHELFQRNFRHMELTWYQRHALRNLWDKQFGYLLMSRGSGKTLLLAVYSLLWALLYPNQRVLVVSASYRQAVLVMREIERIWQESPAVQASSEGEMVFGTIQSEILLQNGSYVRALPLGDGTKIRGERANVLCVDEYAQVPKSIMDTVVRPFLNVRSDPMNPHGQGNRMVVATTAYYQFNHAYQLYLDYRRRSDPNSPDYHPQYFLGEYTYHDAPPGFMDLGIIEEAKRQMEHAQFLMEYENVWLTDTEGYFPRSLVERAQREWLTPRLKGEPGRQYVMGIDPARTRDAFAIALIELADPGAQDHRLVYLDAHYGAMFQEMVQYIRELLLRFPVVRLYMDAGGGGTTVRDLLAEPYLRWNDAAARAQTLAPILELDNEQFRAVSGERILRLIKFTPPTINKMNSDLKAALEQGHLLLMGRIGTENIQDPSWVEEAKILENQKELITQMANIVATPNKTGYFGFDTAHRSQHKDLYSALLLAYSAALEMRSEQMERQLVMGQVVQNVAWFRTPQNPWTAVRPWR